MTQNKNMKQIKNHNNAYKNFTARVINDAVLV